MTTSDRTRLEPASRKRGRRPARPRDTIVGRLKAADPFELIRWLARSQPDPRKALAELVQNSLDAGARRIEITRVRERGVLTLRILDDGLGVIPELGRREALGYIATHIGHSRKRSLDPQQRRELLLQGKYGIGLLGFWAIGSELEIRTQLPGEPAQLLRLHEESPQFEIEPYRGRLAFGDRYTEVVVRGMHRAAAVSLTSRRMAEFLAAELRGQLIEREIDLVIRDRIARGRAPKVLTVRPTRFEGDRLELPESLECPGFSTIRVELYLLPPGAPKVHGVAISCAGTIVYDDIADIEISDFRRRPWTEDRLTGLLEFADFQVPPGTRRGVQPDAAALAFVHAVSALEPEVAALVSAAEERAAAAVEANLMRQLERAFREVSRLAPEYDFFAVQGPDRARVGASAPGPDAALAVTDAAEGAVLPASDAEEHADEEAASDEVAELFPPGPLAALEIAPGTTRVEPRGRRRLRAIARDERGRAITDGVSITWEVRGGPGEVTPRDGSRVEFVAHDVCGSAVLEAAARQGSAVATASAVVEIAEAGESARSARTGIPEPTFVEAPAAPWRSRMNDGRWEVNSGHADFRVAMETTRRKLRYLTALLAKEVVVHSFPGPNFSPALERLIGVLTITERSLER
jgi:hypothetical protein